MAYILQQLLSKSAARFPEKPAVWARGRSITYRELDERSNQLAHLLVQSGVRKGDRVGLFFPKSVESVISMFAILKAGGVYIPLDPQSPVDRVGYIIGNCGIRVLITQDEKRRALDSVVRESLDRCVIVDQARESGIGTGVLPWSALQEYPSSHPPVVTLTETDLAYILYTSGSTGRPKGVMLTHQNALTFVEWCAEKFHVTHEDHLSNHAPLHFDLSVFDVYNTIEAGATVYLVTEEIALFPTTLQKFMETHQISIWYSVPSALVLLLLHADLKAERLPHLRTILFAGEVFPMKYLKQLAELLPAVELDNLYGPTETNVCTYYRVERDRLAGMDKLPIGIACENTEVFAVDDQDEIVTEPGQSGELYVRGPSVTYGYWGDEEKTKKMVVPNRFQSNFDEKIYRTGDLVTLAEDGNYYFVGRRDSMIKSRGYRIELGEIESALLSHPGVREAAAIPIPDEVVGNRIKAIIALHEADAFQAAALQQHCATRIPKYMIPELIEFRESLPKTSTGKIDRVSLVRDSQPLAV
ncbi:MAG TPA: amino acid adenylation domain-containing protein [Candidatus Aquilonibacter sp.]|jgi:amino acid adenylation domain-containing protein|nr:amino acid adenylation domain-containing protein [Candidatus Aquilonibacter sp.]